MSEKKLVSQDTNTSLAKPSTDIDKGELVKLLKHYRKLCEAAKEPEKPLCDKVLSSFKPIEMLALKKSNQTCADCGCPEPKWTSSNLGVFICIKCSGVHRSLGSHISKVLSAVIDDWADSAVEHMKELGNKKVNKIYEANIPPNYRKPTPEESMQHRKKYIVSKYVRKRFTADYKDDEQDPQYDRTSKDAPETESRKSMAMVEYVGVLSIKLIGGTDLVAMDLNGKSDPFVVFRLGEQKAKSTIKMSTLHPIWNENFQLCVKDKSEKLLLKVYDYDMGKKDDDMGEGVVELSTIASDKPTYHCCKLTKVKKGEIHMELTFTSLS